MDKIQNTPFDGETFAGTMLEPLFYFAMSRTGDENEASALVSDIAEAVLTALGKGKTPADPQAWVWAVAKNRYARYVKNRIRERERTVSIAMDEGDFELPDTDETPEERLLLSEEEAEKREHLAKLRENLAHIRSDWRQVLVAYYMENLPIREIAASLSLPEGTVKTKLYQSRKYLKEGIFMARTYGKLSYAPENVNFSMSGYTLDQRPWSIITHKLHKNILLAAYRTPSTAEDLAMEMGIALPYMEDELEFLVRETLLLKNGDKYETGFMILSADAQAKMQENLAKITPKVTELLTKAVEVRRFDPIFAGFRWHGGYVPEEEIRWVKLMQEADRIGWETYSKDTPDSHELPERPNGRWNLLGYEGSEEYSGPFPFVGQHGIMDTQGREYIDFSQFKFNWNNISSRTPLHLDYAEGETLKAVCLGEPLTEENRRHIQALLDAGYIKADGDGYSPSLFVEYQTVINENLSRLEAENPAAYADWEGRLNVLTDEAIALVQSHTDFCRGVIAAEVPDFLKDNQFQQNFALSSGVNLRGAVFTEAIRTGWLTYDPETSSQSLGAYIRF